MALLTMTFMTLYCNFTIYNHKYLPFIIASIYLADICHMFDWAENVFTTKCKYNEVEAVKWQARATGTWLEGRNVGVVPAI